MEILLTLILDALLSPVIAAVDGIDSPPKAVVAFTVLGIVAVYAAMAFHKSVQPLALLLCLALVSCEGTVVRKGRDKLGNETITIADGSAATRVKGHQEVIVEVPGFGTVTKRTWDRDQTAVPKGWMMWGGLPSALTSGGKMTKDVADGVGAVIK